MLGGPGDKRVLRAILPTDPEDPPLACAHGSVKVSPCALWGQLGTIFVSPSPLARGLQNTGQHDTPRSRGIIAEDPKDVPSAPLPPLERIPGLPSRH